MHVFVFYPLLNWKMHGETMKFVNAQQWNWISEFECSSFYKVVVTLYAGAVKESCHRSDQCCTLWSLDPVIDSG